LVRMSSFMRFKLAGRPADVQADVNGGTFCRPTAAPIRHLPLVALAP
jgi:hypothetical protein